jgi:hypothetical protein
MSKPQKKMGRPPKDKDHLMNVAVRIMVTADQKKLLDEATAIEGGELSAWARPLLLDAAKKRIAKAEP